MEASELNRNLSLLNWSQTELSRRVNVNKNTVGKWVKGTARIPGGVAAYLLLKVKVREAGE